jgi:hypothetical protein
MAIVEEGLLGEFDRRRIVIIFFNNVIYDTLVKIN